MQSNFLHKEVNNWETHIQKSINHRKIRLKSMKTNEYMCNK